VAIIHGYTKRLSKTRCSDEAEKQVLPGEIFDSLTSRVCSRVLLMLFSANNARRVRTNV
jgi:hypothetical protein